MGQMLSTGRSILWVGWSTTWGTYFGTFWESGLSVSAKLSGPWDFEESSFGVAKVLFLTLKRSSFTFHVRTSFYTKLACIFSSSQALHQAWPSSSRSNLYIIENINWIVRLELLSRQQQVIPSSANTSKVCLFPEEQLVLQQVMTLDAFLRKLSRTPSDPSVVGSIPSGCQGCAFQRECLFSSRDPPSSYDSIREYLSIRPVSDAAWVDEIP